MKYMKLLLVFGYALYLNFAQANVQSVDLKQELEVLKDVCPVQWESLDQPLKVSDPQQGDTWRAEEDYLAWKNYFLSIPGNENLSEKDLLRAGNDRLTILADCAAQRVKVMVLLGGTPLGDAGVTELATQIANSEDGSIILGSRTDYPAASCSQIKDQHESAESGYYWIKLGVSSNLYHVYCEMQFRGGGWMYWGYLGTDASPENLFGDASVDAEQAAAVVDYDRYRRKPLDAAAMQRVFPLSEFADSEMILSLDTPSIRQAKTMRKYIQYRYEFDNPLFNQGPLPCTETASFEYSRDGFNYSEGSVSHCTENYVYLTSAEGYLNRFYTDKGVFWGAGMRGNNSWHHSAWVYVR